MGRRRGRVGLTHFYANPLFPLLLLTCPAPSQLNSLPLYLPIYLSIPVQPPYSTPPPLPGQGPGHKCAEFGALKPTKHDAARCRLRSPSPSTLSLPLPLPLSPSPPPSPCPLHLCPSHSTKLPPQLSLTPFLLCPTSPFLSHSSVTSLLPFLSLSYLHIHSQTLSPSSPSPLSSHPPLPISIPFSLFCIIPKLPFSP